MSLRKEMIIAILFGLLLGGGAALLFAQIPQKLSGNNEDTSKVLSNKTPPTPSPTPLSVQGMTLDILFPDQQGLVSEEIINVSGKTMPNSTVAITSAINEIVTIADNDGTFSAPIELTEGANEILVVSYDNTNEAEKIVVVNYTPEEL